MRRTRGGASRRAVLRRFRGRPKPAAVPAPPAATVSGELLRATRPGMGSFFEIRLSPRTPGAIELATRALDQVDALEAQLTIYRDDSEVSRLNAVAHLGPVPVEEGLLGLLETGLRIGRETGGAYDLASGALSLAWGFVRGPRRVPGPPSLAEALQRSGGHHVRLDPAARTVAFDRDGIVLNLGSIGKGYAVDRAAGVIRDHWWPTGALVHGGQSSIYALGSPPWNFGGRWKIALRNPFRSEQPLGILYVRNRGVGTSGAAFQAFEAEGRRYGHIIDPRTGSPPADGPASVTVVSPTATESDALSTAFYLMGEEQAASYIARHPRVGAIFLRDGTDDARPRMTVLNLTPADFEPAPDTILLRTSVP